MSSTRFRKPRTFLWLVFGLLLFALTGQLVVEFIGSILLGVFIYYAARPIYRRVHTVVPYSNISAIASLVLFVLPAVLLVGYTVSVALTDLRLFLQLYDVSQVESVVRPYFETMNMTASSNQLFSPPDSLSPQEQITTLKDSLEYVLSSLSVVGSLFLNLMIALIVAFYLLRDDGDLYAWLDSQATDNGVWEEFSTRVDEDLSGIFFGNILNAVITSVIGVLVYSILEFLAPGSLTLGYPALFGLLCGIASLIPIIGIKIVYVPMAAYLGLQAMAQGESSVIWFPLVFIALSAIIVDFIPDMFLRPYVSGKNVHIGLLMLAYILGSAFFGWYGLFLGPAILVFVTHFTTLILPRFLDTYDSRPRFGS